MKKYFLLASAFIISTATMAQSFSFGPEIGLNMSKLKVENDGGIPLDMTNRTGMRIGVTANVGFGSIAIQPGIFYSMKGGKMSGTIIDTSGFIGNIAIEGETKLGVIEIPVLVQYKHGVGPGKLFIGAGPVANIALSGTYEATALGFSVSDDVKFGSDSTMMKRTSFGLMVNIGYEFNMGLFIRPFYQVGLSKMDNDGSGTKNDNFGISVGYLFGKRD